MRTRCARRLKRIHPFAALCSILVLLLVSTGNAFAQTNLVDVGHTNNGEANGIAVSGNYAFTANQDGGLWIYDISNPSIPVNVSSINNAGAFGTGEGVAVSGSYAFLASRDALHIYNISNPTNPFQVGQYAGLECYSVAVSGHYAYVAADYPPLTVLDVSTPSNPVRVGATTNQGPGLGVAVLGNYAYVAARTNAGYIYDISNPSNIVFKSAINCLSCGLLFEGVAVSGDHAYFSGGSGLRIIDVSNPSAPIFISNSNDESANGVAVAGNYAYLNAEYDGLRIYDVSNPASPVLVANASDYGGGTFSGGVAVSGSYAYVANGDDGLRIYSLGVPSPPQLSINQTGTNTLIVSWPAPAAAFVLQQISDLATSNWVTVSNASTVVAGQNQIILPQPAGIAFYRLKFP